MVLSEAALDGWQPRKKLWQSTLRATGLERTFDQLHSETVSFAVTEISILMAALGLLWVRVKGRKWLFEMSINLVRCLQDGQLRFAAITSRNWTSRIKLHNNPPRWPPSLSPICLRDTEACSTLVLCYAGSRKMTSYTPATDLWLERSRLDGMMLGAVSYGVLLLLTLQAVAAILSRRRHGNGAVYRPWLLAYIVVTFVLATIGFAANLKYTEMIWIDLRDAPGGPVALIEGELSYWINVMALTCYYVMEWFMQALLLHRCVVVWNGNRYIAIFMTSLLLTMIALSIGVLAGASGAVFYNINTQLAYLCVEVGMTVAYTLLVSWRLLKFRRGLEGFVGSEHLRTYNAAVTMVVESAAMYSVLGVIFIISYALHSNISNLVLLSISHVQASSQLIIIIRVAQGRAVGMHTLPETGADSVVFATYKTEDCTVPSSKSRGTESTAVEGKSSLP